MRLTRSEIAEWYDNVKIPQKDGIVFRAMLDDDRLILGIYSEKEKRGIYILHRDGRRATKRAKLDGWGTEGIKYLLGGDWFYGCDRYGELQRFADFESEQIAREYIDEQCDYYGDKIVEKLMSIDNRYNERQRETREHNKARRTMSFVNALPPLPEGFEEWCHRVVFSGENYMFGRAKCNSYYCTACGKKHTVKGLKDRQITVCGRTGAPVKVTKRREVIEKRGDVMLLQNVPDGHAFGSVAVSRHRYVWGTWDKSGFKLNAGGYYDDYMVLLLPKNGEPCTRWFYHYNGWGGEAWSDKNRAGARLGREYLFPDTVKDALEGTCYGRLGLDVAAANGWRVNYNGLMIDRCCKQTEYLIKGGFYRLVAERGDRSCNASIPKSATDLRTALLLDGQGVARMRRLDGGGYMLSWLRSIDMCGERLSDEYLKKLEAWAVSPTKLAYILNYGLVTPTQVINYIEKQLRARGRMPTRIMAHSLIEEWKDYLSMAEKFKLDTYNEMIFKPKDLKARHDELLELLNAERDKEECERIEAEYPEIMPACHRIKPIYEWRGEKFSVIVPSGAADIMREGRLLKHCVGSTDRYFDRIADGESYVMFLRKNASPDTPWYTMEVEPGGKVRQLRTLGDAEGNDRKEAKAALSAWRAAIKDRLEKTGDGRVELALASVSREKRLAEFEELRRGGNIIRNGKLAGRLLVEVLEADFKEYNDEETA